MNREGKEVVGLAVYFWGVVTAILSSLCLVIIAIAAFFIVPPDGWSANTPALLSHSYTVLKDQGTIIGAVLGFSALAWAYFFQAWMAK